VGITAAIDSVTGVVTVADPGQWDRSVDPNPTITVLATSTDGSVSSSDFTINLADGTVPTALDDSNTVDEAALANGTDAGSGSNIATGNLFANDALEGASLASINGVPPSGGTITVTTPYGELVVVASGPNAGDYTYTLTAATTEGATDQELFNYLIQQPDGDFAGATLTINVNDDAPVSGDILPDVVLRTTPVNSELTIVLDKSGSMGDTVLDADGNPITRYELAVRAVDELVDTYDSLGQVRVNVVMFDDNTVGGISDWFDNAADVVDYIDNYSPGGGTDYDDPLRTLVDDYAAPAGFTPDQSFAYFMSDGDPNTATYRQEIVDYESTWRGWADSVYDKVYSVGLGSGVASTYLDLVASEEPDGTENTIIIPDESLLISRLLETIPQVQNGDFTGANTFGLNSFIPGADQPGQILSITIEHLDIADDSVLDSITYDRNSPEVVDDVLTITTARGADVQVNFATGEYSYNASSGSNGGNDFKETIMGLFEDADGDTGTATATFYVNQLDGLNDGQTFTYDGSAVEGTVGFDTLIVENDDDLDFSGISDISNIERLDLSSVGENEILNLSVDDVLDMTDSNNLLEILGNSVDSVNLENSGGKDWQEDGQVVQDGVTFNKFVDASGATTTTLLIEETVIIDS